MRSQSQRQRVVSLLFVSGLFALFALAVGCESTTPPPADEGTALERVDLSLPEPLDTDDAAAIYELVIRQVCGPDDTFGGSLDPAVAYVVGTTGGASMDPDAPVTELMLLPDSLEEAISDRLSDAPFEVVWVESEADVERDADGRVSGNGVIVTLGSLAIQEDGSVAVSGQIYIANLAAGLRTYVIEMVDGVWTITGTVGPTVIS